MTERDHESERVSRFEDYDEDEGEGWQEAFVPGTFGCHELLARLSMTTECFAQAVLDHPSLFIRPDWYATAAQAFDRLNDLRREIAAVHFGDQDNPTENAATARPR